MIRSILTGAAVLAMLAGASLAQERCDFWVPPAPIEPAKPAGPAKPADPAAPVAKPKPPQTEFWVIAGGTLGAEITLLGDSLTSPHFGQTVSALLGERQYKIYAIGGTSAQMLSGLFETVMVPNDAVGIIWIGRNNNPADVKLVLKSIASAASHIPSGKYLILDVLTGRNADEQPGGGRRVNTDALNEAIRAKYGDRVISVRPLVTCGDFSDYIHLFNSGQDKIAKAVADQIWTRRW